MGFFEHLEELRSRLMRCLWVFFAGFIVFYFCSEPILQFLRAPLFKVLPPDQQKLYFTSLFENFLTHLKIAGYTSLVFLSPYFFSEVWRFIAPGLYPQERKYAVPFVVVSSVFFVGGALFAYYILFPVGFKFFVTYGSPTDVPMLTIDSYYSTCLKLMLLFGVAFEIPVIITLLGLLGVVSSTQLKQSRKNAIIGMTILAAFFAPPDAVSMLILLAPLLLMYEGAILIIAFSEKRRPPKEAANSTETKEPHSWAGKSDEL